MNFVLKPLINGCHKVSKKIYKIETPFQILGKRP